MHCPQSADVHPALEYVDALVLGQLEQGVKLDGGHHGLKRM